MDIDGDILKSRLWREELEGLLVASLLNALLRAQVVVQGNLPGVVRDGRPVPLLGHGVELFRYPRMDRGWRVVRNMEDALTKGDGDEDADYSVAW